MKVKFGSIVTDGRGKLGGHVYSKNRGGAYVKTKVTPANPQTSYQQNIRSLFTALTQAWRALTAAQRLAWNSAVSNFTQTDIFGDGKTLSGQQLYIKLNMLITTALGSEITTPPTPGTAPEVVTWSTVPDASPQTLSITFAASPVPANHAYIVEATPCVSPGKNFLKNQFRIINILAAAATTPSNSLATYQSKYGDLVAGQKVALRIRSINLLTGAVSQPTQHEYIVAS